METHFLFTVLIIGAISCNEGPDFNREADFNFGWEFYLQNDTTAPGRIPLEYDEWRDFNKKIIIK